MNYVFDEKSIRKFKYCPFCKSEIMEVYDGDYSGYISCSNLECEEDDEMSFIILEEMISRYPKWLDRIKGKS